MHCHKKVSSNCVFKEFFFSEVGGIGVKSLRKCQNATFFRKDIFIFHFPFLLKSKKLGQTLKTFDLDWLCSTGNFIYTNLFIVI